MTQRRKENHKNRSSVLFSAPLRLRVRMLLETRGEETFEAGDGRAEFGVFGFEAAQGSA